LVDSVSSLDSFADFAADCLVRDFGSQNGIITGSLKILHKPVFKRAKAERRLERVSERMLARVQALSWHSQVKEWLPSLPDPALAAPIFD
jgi:hypothetical protein